MKRTRRDIRNLIFLFAGSTLVALFIVWSFLYYLGSSGTYRVNEVLISPKALEKLEQKDRGRFVYDKIEFVHSGIQGQGWRRFAVSLQSYRAFYDQVAHLRSIPQISGKIVGQFEISAPSTLTIFSQREREKPAMFQQVEFLEDSDLFRVQRLPALDIEEEWIYFSSPGIYKEVIELFAPTVEK